MNTLTCNIFSLGARGRAGFALPAGVALAALLLALLIPALWPGVAGAQDIEGLKSQQTKGVAGPYTIEAEARPLPSLQAAHHIIRVTDSDTGAPVENVRVTVLTSLQGTEESGWAYAISPNTPGVYSATVEIKEPGTWETTLLIEPPDGGSYGIDGFTFEVIAPTQDRAAGFVFLGVAVVIIGGGVYLTWQSRRNGRRRLAGAGLDGGPQ